MIELSRDDIQEAGLHKFLEVTGLDNKRPNRLLFIIRVENLVIYCVCWARAAWIGWGSPMEIQGRYLYGGMSDCERKLCLIFVQREKEH